MAGLPLKKLKKNLKDFANSIEFSKGERVVLWMPVGLGLGIALSFACAQAISWSLLGLLLVSLSLASFRFPKSPLFLAMAVLIGMAAAQWRIEQVNPRPLFRPLKDITFAARVAAITWVQSRKEGLEPRLILAPLNRPDLPKQVQASGPRLRIAQEGDRLYVRATLVPVRPGPSPFSYDFRRHAYFQGIGGRAFVHEATVLHTNPHPPFWERMRGHLSRFFLDAFPQPLGAIACALVTGEKGVIPAQTRKDFSGSGLSHVLAISGLHLSIIAGFFFVLIRGGLCLAPSLRLPLPAHKVASLLSIFGITGYLAISGGGVPVKRAYLMALLALLAILADRRVLTLRSLALAASTLLLFQPEALLTPSFQMSFAAATALVGAYQDLRTRFFSNWQDKKFLSAFLGVLLSSLLASLATLPYTLWHFHFFSVQGILANLVGIPLMAFWVMPCAALTVAGHFLGIPWVIPLLSWGLQALVGTASFFAALPLAFVPWPLLPTWEVVLFTLGGLWLILEKSKLRWGGSILLVGGVCGLFVPVPARILLCASPLTVGVFDQKTLWILGQGYPSSVAKSWQQELGATAIRLCPPRPSWTFNIKGRTLKVSQDAREDPQCREADVLISLAPLGGRCYGPPLRLDRWVILRAGVLAIDLPSLRVHTRPKTHPWH